MGWLLKIILFFVVFAWIMRGIMRFFVGGLTGQAQQRNFRQQQQSQRKRTGDVHVDHNPQKSKRKRSSENFKGGDYIDYEEVD